jgi:hypothetical protein
MDIHKPKAAHSVREFLTEIGTIICGILIALGLEQAVEQLHWRHVVSEAKDGMSTEIGGLLGLAQARTETMNCVEGRLDQLATLVDSAERTGRLTAYGPPGFPGTNGWSSGVWQSTVAGQVSAHLDRAELRAYTATYNFVSLIASDNRREVDVWTTLYGLAGPGRRFTPNEAAIYRQAIAEARTLDISIAATALRARQVSDAGRLNFDHEFYKQYHDGAVKVVRSSLCGPVPATTPSHYGASPREGSVDMARSNPITARGLGTR